MFFNVNSGFTKILCTPIVPLPIWSIYKHMEAHFFLGPNTVEKIMTIMLF